MSDFLKLVGLGIVIILPLANPITTVALMLGLSKGMSCEERNRQVDKASIYVFIIMMLAYYAGQIVMSTFGISIPGLRVAGGMIVCFIGFKMLFPFKSELILGDSSQKNIAFIPLAMPSTAGPGAIAMIVSTASTINQLEGYEPWMLVVAPPIVFFIVSVILWGCLKSGEFIMRLIGQDGVEAISRLMGFLLVCMGVQFVINGIIEEVTKFQSI